MKPNTTSSHIHEYQEEQDAFLSEKSQQDSQMSKLMLKLRDMDLSHVKSKIELQKDEEISADYESDFNESIEDYHISLKQRPTSGCNLCTFKLSLVIRTAPPKSKSKKNDPVTRFKQHQEQWAKDQFLKRSQAKMEHPASGGSIIPRTLNAPKRHNLAQMRSNYVVPTSKLRRDVVWETRTRLAHSDP